MDPEQIGEEIVQLMSRIGSDDPPSIEELEGARSQLAEALEVATTPGQIDLDAARALRNAIKDIDVELDRRKEVAAAEEAEAAELRQGIVEEPVAEDLSDEGERQSAEEPEEEPEEPQQPESVAAGAGADRSERARAAATSLARLRSRPTVVSDDDSNVVVMLNGPAIDGGSPPKDLISAAELFTRHAHRVATGKAALVSLQKQFPEDRSMTASAANNTRLLDEALDMRALVAAGGICEPLPADFSHPICGERARPIRDSLPNFGATRGGVRFAPTATLADLEGAVTIWTHATDVDPGTATKACPRIDCEEEVEVVVDAVPACLTVGNFQVRFNPEFWRSRLDLLMVLHDRVAEERLFTQMQVAATNVAAPAVDGNTAQSLFLALDRLAAGIRSRHRYIDQVALRYVAPFWVQDAIRSSIARQRGGSFVENLSVAQGVINSFFSERNIQPVWSPDLQIFPEQTAGPLEDWPDDEATGLLYPEGTYFFLDGGTLDLGTEITDSTLNATNDRQVFLETFEQVAFRGCEAVELTVPIGEDCVCVGAATT